MITKAQRTSPDEWRKILFVVYDSLIEAQASDVMLFGSQLMSVYTKRAFASKDLDLIVGGIGMRSLNRVTSDLGKFLQSQQLPTFDYQVTQYEGREYPVSHIYLKPLGKKPFVVELFHTFLGHEIRKLTPYIIFRKVWGREFEVLTLEGVIATRLAFRPPERITPFNARRLNRLIEQNQRKINWAEVREFINYFGLQKIVAENLVELKKSHNIVVGPASKDLRSLGVNC